MLRRIAPPRAGHAVLAVLAVLALLAVIAVLAVTPARAQAPESTPGATPRATPGPMPRPAASPPPNPATPASPQASATGVPPTDDRGRRIVLAAPPRRIVSLLPSLTESVCALGACDRLVGTDRFSNWPASAAALPKLGGLEDVQVERVVALRPDLVLASTSARALDRLEALGLHVVALDSATQGDVRRALALLARLLATPVAAEQVWRDIDRATRAAAARVPAALRGRRVYVEIDPTPYAAGPRSFVGETLQQIGMANAIPEALGPFPKLNPEYVVRLQPDIVIANRRELAAMPARPGWSALRALRTRQTCGFDGPDVDLLVRPGPRIGEAAALLAECFATIAAKR